MTFTLSNANAFNMNTKGIGEHMSLIGLSNKTKDTTHPAKSTRPELLVVRPRDGNFCPTRGYPARPDPNGPDFTRSV